ncbi:hypothetical protein AAMO2058_000843300 [Amorphochlora amoebiformis]
MADLLTLQNLVRRDPEGYVLEFRQQYQHFLSTLEVFRLNPSGKDAKPFGKLVRFLAHVSPCYKKHKEAQELGPNLLTLLDHQYQVLSRDLRQIIVQSLIQVVNRNMLSRFRVLPVFFNLFRCQDKPLRALIFSHVVNDVVKVHEKARDQKVKQYMFFLQRLKDDNSMSVKKGLDAVIELWRRKIWNDAKTVNAIGDLTFSKIGKVKATALRFFLGFHDDEGDSRSLLPQSVQFKNLYLQNANLTNVKRRKKRLRKMERDKKKITKAHREENGSMRRSIAAIHLLYDPQAFAERLFSQLKSCTDPFEVRLLMMNVISRLVGTHRLILLNFYPFLQKYLHSGQSSVTKILAYFAQASHPLVPPEDISPLIRSLADNFVTDRSSPEVMAIGLNAIREVCIRCPLALSSELLQDLAMYKKSKTKGVMMAARGLIAAFREVDPSKLHRKDRGKEASMNPNKTREYGFDGNDEEDNILLSKLMAEEKGDFNAGESEALDEDTKEEMNPEASRGQSEGGEHDSTSLVSSTQEDQRESKSVKVRFLTSKDFRKLKALKANVNARQGKKRGRAEAELGGLEESESDDEQSEGQHESDMSEDETNFDNEEGAEIGEEAIIGYVPRKKLTKEERREALKANKEGLARKWAERNPSGTTNREKLKNKPFQLVKHSEKIKRKKNLAFNDQQKKNIKHIKGLKKLQKKKLKSMRK